MTYFSSKSTTNKLLYIFSSSVYGNWRQMWPNHRAPTGRCSRNVSFPSNQQRLRGRFPEALGLLTNEVPVACDVGPDGSFKQEQSVLPASVLEWRRIGAKTRS